MLLLWLWVVKSASETTACIGGIIAGVQLAGCNTDCGRVEVRLEEGGEWYGVVAEPWTIREATMACRAVGFDEASSASAGMPGGPRRSVRVEMGPEWRVLEVVEAAGVSAACRSSGQGLASSSDDSVANEWKERRERRAAQLPRGVPPPSPFTSEALEAYVFADELRRLWERMDLAYREKSVFSNASVSALGVLDADDAAFELYLSENPHSDFLYETDRREVRAAAAAAADDDDPVAGGIFEALDRDGIAMIKDFGLTSAQLDVLEAQAREAVGASVNVSVASDGKVATARREVPGIEPVLKNVSIARALRRYLGADVLLDGYKVTHLRTSGPGDYIAALWHHDRVGRRIKMFVYVHDVDCDEGHPTLVAKGTHRLSYFRTDSFAASRFRDDYVTSTYPIHRACGPRGGGFIFDTHAVHKGTPEGRFDRLTLIAEFHAVHKCPAARALNLGIPCPSGDQFPLNHRL
ncbi:hypothetical protein CTAYLR_009649 [Chrysophaeum taylorii]|uniref:SRCR domain-containing protein n=1 Tax=Chrysophaeum taylorii TaxID=2483200 RepID=A0AAD7XHU3_9STRA|nr:hypothetical protein CTAYLR_009649 [Chrysophaeum taylorii]